MTPTHWTQRHLPSAERETCVLRWDLGSVAEVTACRGRLRALAAAGTPRDDDAVERLLLTVEELASNGVRHGGAPVTITVTATGTGWLVDVADGAVGRPPTPAIGRDAAEGGLGLHLVADLSSARGWTVRDGRKHVWARIERAAGLPPQRGSDERG
jgi:two-component sensor histidine kinase